MAKPYTWRGDAAATARYPSFFVAGSATNNGVNNLTAAVSAGILANRITDTEDNSVLVRVDQISGNIRVEQPIGTPIATFTPEPVPAFGQT